MTRRRTVRRSDGETDEQRAERLAEVAIASVRDQLERQMRDAWVHGYMTALEETVETRVTR